MRKRNKKSNILSRTKSQREALLKTLANSFFTHGKITTTLAKANELQMTAEKLITRAKTDSITSRRVLARMLPPVTVKKLIAEIAPMYIQRQGGYTRITKMGLRKSDSASMAIIELVK